MKKRLLLDCDGIIRDFLTPALKTIYDVSGKNLDRENMQNWDFFADLEDHHREACYNEFRNPDWCGSIPVYNEALKYLPDVLNKADVYIVTAPFPSRTWAYETTVWLEKLFGIKKEKVIHAHSKYVCSGDIFVDDSPDNVIQWNKHNPDKLTLIWDHPYNRNVPETIKRIYSWKDLIEKL